MLFFQMWESLCCAITLYSLVSYHTACTAHRKGSQKRQLLSMIWNSTYQSRDTGRENNDAPSPFLNTNLMRIRHWLRFQAGVPESKSDLDFVTVSCFVCSDSATTNAYWSLQPYGGVTHDELDGFGHIAPDVDTIVPWGLYQWHFQSEQARHCIWSKETPYSCRQSSSLFHYWCS